MYNIIWYCTRTAAGNAESNANGVTGVGRFHSCQHIFHFGLIGNPCVFDFVTLHPGHFADAAFPAAIEQLIGILIFGENLTQF